MMDTETYIFIFELIIVVGLIAQLIDIKED